MILQGLYRYKWAATWQIQQNGMCSQQTQIILGIRPSDQSLLSTWRKLGSLATHWVHSEDSDQAELMRRLIWVFDGSTVILLVLSWGGSNELCPMKKSLHTFWLVNLEILLCPATQVGQRHFFWSFHRVYKSLQMVLVLVRLHEYTGLPKPSLFALW